MSFSICSSSLRPNPDVGRRHKDQNYITNAWRSMVSVCASLVCRLCVSLHKLFDLVILRPWRSFRYQRMKREIQAILCHFSANRECLLHSGGPGCARTNQDKTTNFVSYYESYTGIGETHSHWLHMLDTECVYMHNYAERAVIKYWINMQICQCQKMFWPKVFQLGYCQ